MNPGHARFADWEAAYLVGALSPSDRRLFEEHLDECAACRDALAELAPTLGLLSRVSPDRAESLLQRPEGAGDVAAGPAPGARSEFVARAAARRARPGRRGDGVRWSGEASLPRQRRP
ncbi:zf-HC2 domain-containing protein [Microbacterium cremeum]|uniref:zf-HC2 domain-containing protein n=1 Tax=Microbacterium cremeum TaxID=2782169 RepID=UPI001887B4D2|nr:zf-HC2 domain-containing protein [Microbacterium cremeum]